MSAACSSIYRVSTEIFVDGLGLEEKSTSRVEHKILVLDTSAFLVGFDPLLFKEQQVTAPMVKDELKSCSLAYVRLKIAIENRKTDDRKQMTDSR